MGTHTGFMVTYGDGTTCRERDMYVDKDGVRRATNWHEVRKADIFALELWWRGAIIVSLSLEDLPGIGPDDWYFSCSGSSEVTSPDRVAILERNIGYRDGSVLNLFSVTESNGSLRTHSR